LKIWIILCGQKIILKWRLRSRGRSWNQALTGNTDDLKIENVSYCSYSLLDTLKNKTENIEIFDYNSLSHEEIVQRTLSDIKPFLPGEKGYRDTLIWLSFLHYLVDKNITRDVVFISNNKDDFFKKKSAEIAFHQDLLEDIQRFEISCKVIPFNSLYSFINSQVDKVYHEVNHDTLIEEAEEFVEIYGIENIENESSLKVAYPSKGGLYQATIKDILSINATIIEGLEDPEIMHISKTSETEVRVGFSYNLRRVSLEIEVSESNYLLNKEEFDEIFFEISSENDVTLMSVVARPYFYSSFIYNINDQDLNDFYVDEISIKI
jgi:hypothetical protein